MYEKAHMAVGKSVHIGPERKANQTSAENCIPPTPPREKLEEKDEKALNTFALGNGHRGDPEQGCLDPWAHWRGAAPMLCP